MKYFSPQDLNYNALQNAIIHPVTSLPATARAGQIVFLTTNNTLYVGLGGTTWLPLDASKLPAGSIPLSVLATDPLARGNHTGTQLAATISNFDTQVRTNRLDQMAAPTASVSLNSQLLTNVLDPTAAQHAATRNYVDNLMQNALAGIDAKPSVRIVATANQTLSGLRTIDGVALAAGDRILLTAQTSAPANGVYVVASSAWTRATDADQTGEVTPGAFWYVEEGTAGAATTWRCNNSGTITIGTTNVSIVQFGAAQVFQAGNGIDLSGNTFSAKPATGGGISVTSAGILLDKAIAARGFAGNITHDGSATEFTVTHGLGTLDIVPAFRDANNDAVGVDWRASSTNALVAIFGSPLANGTVVRATVMGIG